MRKNTCAVCWLVAVVLMTSAMAVQGADWKMVWNDEFEKEGLPDSSKWGYEVGFIRNNELQFYTDGRKENARVEDGVLVIEGRKEKYANPRYDANSRRNGKQFAEYTAASLTTRGKAEWLKGRIEVRAKLPEGRGLWPAIWMLGVDRSLGGWPGCGEIDIMEYVGYLPNTIHANVHTKKYNHTKGTGRGDKIEIKDPFKEFHVYAVEWFDDRMDFYVDDKMYFTCKNDEPGRDAWPFDKPQYLILNLAIGGTWGATKGVDESIFPQKYLIDYVRVYREKTEAEREEAKMVILDTGDKAPAFTLLDQSNAKQKLFDQKGKPVFIYFYPKALTPGCTVQSCAVRDALPDLSKLNVVAYGISPDQPELQMKFDETHSLGFSLLSDPDHKVSEKYGVWVEKSMFGRKYMGINRSSFLIDGKGNIVKAWYKVSPGDTVPNLMKALAEME